MKCLPVTKLPSAAGKVLHDWHAEILAIRAFNHFLLQECLKTLTSEQYTSSFIRRRDRTEISETIGLQPFALRENLKVFMYCSEAPCGDASMELVMKAQDDATPWPAAEPSSSDNDPILKGRANFSELGIVRRKPCMLSKSSFSRNKTEYIAARSDSPLTLSKSCSDKLALQQFTSLLRSLTSILISPLGVYIDTLILPVSQYTQKALDRAFSIRGRISPADNMVWSGGYSFNPFKVCKTDVEFEFSRRNTATSVESFKGSNICAVYNPDLQQTLINGVLQGRRQFDGKGGSALCSARLYDLVDQISAFLGIPELKCVSDSVRYGQLKECDLLQSRREVKEDVRRLVLKGWIRNVGDDFDLFRR